MTAIIAVAQAMLLQQIEPKIQDQITWIDVLIEDGIFKDSAWSDAYGPQLRKMENNKFEITSLDAGMTAYAGAENTNLTPSDIDLTKMYVTPTYTTSSYRISLQAIKATEGNKAALEQLVSLYGMECRRSMLRSKGLYLRGDGSGIVGVLPAGVVTSNTITISEKVAGSVASQNIYGRGTLDTFQVGAQIEFGTEANFAASTQVQATIASIPDDATLVLTGVVTVGAAAGANNRGGDNSATWHIRLHGTYGAVPMGLLGMVDNGTFSNNTTFQGLTRATTPYLNSQVSNPSNATSILQDFRNLYVKVRKFNPTMKVWVVSDDVYNNYTNAITVTVQAQQSEAAYTSKLGSVHTGLAFAYGAKPIPILLDTLLPYGTALLLDSDQYFITELMPDAYVPDGVLTRVPGTILYETARAAFYNFGTFSPRKLGGRIQYQA